MDTDYFDAEPGANREYRDTVFTLLFGTKEKAIEVSNSVLGTNYGPDTEVVFTTLKNVLSRERFNDLSFVLDGKLIVLIEHQSTVNKNMPLRMLIYIAKIYDRMYQGTDLLYKTNMIDPPPPEPVFVVFQNGNMQEEKQELRLSDMFAKAGLSGCAPNLELVVTVYNINKGHNPEIMRRSPTLNEYGLFVSMILENLKTTNNLYKALKKAVDDCIKQNILKDFLIERMGEIMGLLTREWKLEEAVVVAREEGVEEGMERGMEKGMEEGMEKGRRSQAIDTAKNLLEGGIGVDDVAKYTGLTVDDILRL